MKTILFALAFFVSGTCMAGVDLNIKNAVIIDADFNLEIDGQSHTILAPWFMVDLTVTNNTQTSITLTGISVLADKARIAVKPRELVPGDSFTQKFYVDQVASVDSNFGYVELYGRFGPTETDVVLASSAFSISH